MRNGWKVFFVAAFVVACGPVAVQEGSGGVTPTPTPSGSPSATPTPAPAATPPSQASFDTNVQPILDAKTCGRAGCHMPPSGGGGVNLVTMPTVATPANKITNVSYIACNGPLDTFQPAAGSFLTFFCTNATTPQTASTHVPSRYVAGTFTAADCTAMFNWVATGSAGALPSCP